MEGLEGVNLDGEWSTQRRKRRSDIDVPTLMVTRPEFGEMARGLEGYIRDRAGVHRAAAIALIYDKHAAGEVNSPGGYLRGMF